VAGETDTQGAGGSPSRRIAADLRAAIQAGEYRPGHQLPSTSALMKRYDVARQTVQNAFDILHSEGLTVGRPGAGVFVRERPTVRRVARNRLSRAERAEGRGAFLSGAAGSFTPTVATTVRVEPADPRTAAALDIPEGSEVLVRDRVMSADDIPVQLSVSRLPRLITLGTRIEEVDTGPGGMYGVLEEAGHRLDHFVEYVSARPATGAEADRMRLAPGAEVLDVTRIAFDTGGTPVEVNRMVLAGERYELVYEIDAD
jgi:GntR family transcriptional regulator